MHVIQDGEQYSRTRCARVRLESVLGFFRIFDLRRIKCHGSLCMLNDSRERRWLRHAARNLAHEFVSPHQWPYIRHSAW